MPAADRQHDQAADVVPGDNAIAVGLPGEVRAGTQALIANGPVIDS